MASVARGTGYTGEIIEQHALGPREGEYISVSVDFILLHDPTLALLLGDLKTLGKGIWDKEKVLITIDHFSPPASVERANVVKDVLSFVDEQKVIHCLRHEGICHQLLVEGPWVGPGMLVIGADSHTTTAGALGCFASGMGSTDILYALVTGKTWLRPPSAVRVDLEGTLPLYVMGKDVILHLLGNEGEDGFLYQALEFYDREGALSMEDRFAISNMAVEGGAKNALFVPDGVTAGYLEQRGGLEEHSEWAFVEEPAYEREIGVALPSLTPKVALPHSPARVVDVAEAKGEKIQQVFIGSCTGGRLSDLAAAARILKGVKIPRHIRLLVTPASRKIFQTGMERGYVQDISEAGGVILNPSCGPCGGIDKGILAADETCISTSNRNFQGRMGDPSSYVYLASPLTAAATALRGVITDPREVM